MISPCIDELDFSSDIYLLSYDYKASSSYFNEQFSVYLNDNTRFDGNERFIATHTFNNTDYVHAVERTNFLSLMVEDVLTNAHIMFKAESSAGTDGFSIDNVSIKKGKSVMIFTDGNGSVDLISNDKFPMVFAQNLASYLVPVNEEATIYIEANEGYHVSAIYHKNGADWELVRAENPNNAIVDFYSFVVGNNGENSYRVTFAPNSYTVNATVNNLYYTPYNNNAVGGIYTPAHENVAHGGSHTGVITLAPHYHLEYVTVNGMEVAPVPSNIDGQYLLTLDPVMENKDVEVFVEIDSTYIVYTVNGGQGTINGHYVVDGTAPYPVVFTEALVGYSNFLTSVMPAPGYHVASIVIDGVEHTNISEYYFEHLFGEHTVVVLFEKDHYYITTAGYGNGTVSEGEDFDYDPEYTYTFVATPDAGYHIASIYRNNVALVVDDPVTGYTETLTNILSDYNYQVHFMQNVYTVTATSGLNGTVTPAGTSSYLFGQDVEYNVNANQGYYIASVMIDGEPILFEPGFEMTSYTYTFANIAANHTISATFAQKMFTVTVNAGAHGTITPATAAYAYGTDVTFNIAPAAGYTIADVTVDGNSVGAVSTYTIPYITSDHTIAATFAATQYTINASASVGGTITPDGATLVAHNGSQTYTISANAGYHVAGVYVDGASVGAVNSYNFTNVTADHQIYAAFEANEFTVTVNQPLHGTITPGTTTVPAGATPAFVITPDLGYEVTQITVNGSNVALANVPNVNGTYTYTFAAVNANQTITATMTAKTFTINATAGANGSITPNGSTTVAYGASKSYTITPNAGYEVNNVTVDGMNMGAITSYTFTNVTANHTINATFKMIDCEVPTFLYSSHIDDNSAMLHWSHPTATSFDIQYKTATSNFTSIGNVSGNSYQVTDLNPNTTYMWQVRANCSANNHSDWSNLVTFKTENTPIVGIEDLVKNNIKVYGEHQNVHILNPEGMNIENVRIFDAYGRLIYSGAVSSSHEVIGLNVAAGTYIVNVTTDQGVANYKVTIMK
jgi:SpoU rRNA methylase family enzyme